MEDREDQEEPTETWISAGVVLQTSMEQWPQLKEALRLAGGKIVYQRMAPPGVKLYITERVREEGP